MSLTPLTYNSLILAVSNLAIVDVVLTAGVETGDSNWETMVPNMITYAEGRISRNLDLLALETSNAYALTTGNNLLSIPVGDFVTLQTISVNGVPLLPVTKEFLQAVYGASGTLGAPIYFAMYGGDRTTGGNTSTNVIVGPWPDSNYAVTVTGTTRGPTLYAYANTTDAGTKTTFISSQLPDLLVQACLQYISEFQRNFLANANDPQMPGNYEAAYQNLLRGVMGEDLRKRFRASAWSAEPTSAIATPGR